MLKQKSILLILVIAFAVSEPCAQTKTPVNSLKGGKWAFSFLLGTPQGSDDIGSVTLTVKPQVTKLFAIRLGTSAYINYGNSSASREGTYLNRQNQSSTVADIFLNFLFYTNPTKPLSFYLGLGPVYRYTESKADYLSNGAANNGDSYTSEKGFAVGGFGVFGAEWFAFQKFSFSAEYNFMYTYGLSHGTSTYVQILPSGMREYDVSVSEKHIETWNLRIIKLGFSVYF